ncbi:MAG TPA: hypothetical protein VHR72_02510 [Gemmataceae bacterium]|jgi:hypothetical protein|nr:hypothetical protein [Gemmataceae bacterium]
MTDTELLGDQYVASFGKDAALGCFTSPQPIALARGESVLLRTPRGIEVGEILCSASIRQARLLGAQIHGELVRAIADADRDHLARLERAGQELLDTARRLADDAEIAVVLLDAELLFDGRHAVVQILHADSDALAGFVAELTSRTGIEIRLANLAQPLPPEPEEHGCGKPDCGSGEGGCTSCSTGGGCSSCSAGDKVDLRPYFAHLRDRMETSQRVPLN